MTRRTILSLALSVAAVTAAPRPAPARTLFADAFNLGPRTSTLRANRCYDVRNRLIDWAAYLEVQRRYGTHYPWFGVNLAKADASTIRTTAPTESRPRTYTDTNVQERGVDEADQIKTDGKFIYVVSDRQVLIADSWPADKLSIVSRVRLPEHVTPRQLLLRGDRLIVLSGVSEPLDLKADRRLIPSPHDPSTRFSGTRVSIVNVSNRRSPRVIRNTDIEGRLTTSRMVGDDLYLVSNANLSVPPELAQAAQKHTAGMPGAPKIDSKRIRRPSSTNLEATKRRAFYVLRTHLRRQFRHLNVDRAMPRMREGTRYGHMGETTAMLSCRQLYVPRSGSELGMLSVAHIDIDERRGVNTTGVFANGWTVYASESALYVAMPNWGRRSFWQFGSDVRSNPNTSQIHKFAIGRRGRPRYVASGRVRGHLLNQFSMSEHEGYLRVATTDASWRTGMNSARPSGSNVFVLRQRGYRLAVTGSVTGLAPGERIYAARMFGDTGYVVTFRQTDPLYTLDLSDPRRPRVVGELKVNGFSSYIHPIDRDRLLTIGQDADDDGRLLGAHLQVFDVSNPARPIRVHHERMTLGRSYSTAQWDHHAFTYDPDTRTVTLPLSTSGPGGRWSGLVTYRIDRDAGFALLGRIDHASLIDGAYRAHCAQNPSSYQCRDPKRARQSFAWRAGIQRTIVMEDIVYSLSQLGIQANQLGRRGRLIGKIAFAEHRPDPRPRPKTMPRPLPRPIPLATR